MDRVTRDTAARPRGGWRGLPGAVWAMGCGSLLMDVSSEMIHVLLPVFLMSTLGASVATIGLIEGIAEATAAMLKGLSGVLSDFLRRRKLLMMLGYALSAFTKPLFPLAAGIGWVFTARFVDRIGKGIRVAPRDALIADITPRGMRGAAYGLRQALDSSGALLGPLLAMVFLALMAQDMRFVMWIATVPAFAAVLVLALFVRERDVEASARQPPTRLTMADARRLPRRYRAVVLAAGVFTLARFSEAFLVLRAQDVGAPLAFVPAVFVAMNACYAAAAYPAGALSDRYPPHALLLAGLAVLVAADLVLAAATGMPLALLGAALWGLHMGLTQGLWSKLVADTAPEDLRGTAFGLYNLVSAGALLLASAIAGAMWTAAGPSGTFLLGAVFAALAAIALLGLPRAAQAR